MTSALVATLLLHGALGLFCLGCFLVVEVRLFQVRGVWRGLLGLVCWPYAFFWALLEAESVGLRTVTRLWSGAVVLAFANLTLFALLRALA